MAQGSKEVLGDVANLASRSNLVIGLTGPFGSGCSSMFKVLGDMGFVPFKISDCIREELDESNKRLHKGAPGWRSVLQEHGNQRRRTDERCSYWIHKVTSKIDEANLGDQKIVIDGFRNFRELQEFRRIYPRFFLVAICASKDERWKRLQLRGDYKDYSEFELDDRRDQNEDVSWGQSVQKCVDDADYVYFNDEHLVVSPQGQECPNVERIERTLKERAEDFVPLMEGIQPGRSPTAEEIQIAAAYAQSRGSTCLKRHVGAIITIDRNGQEHVVSTGFNENPPQIPTCQLEGACYKDEDMRSKLRVRGEIIHCLRCGKKHENMSEPWICDCGTSFKEWLHPNRNMELCTAIHAEERAILSLGWRFVEGATIYATTFPCFQCARLILDSGIKRLVFVEAYPVADTMRFLKKNGIDVVPFGGFTSRAFFTVFPKVN